MAEQTSPVEKLAEIADWLDSGTGVLLLAEERDRIAWLIAERDRLRAALERIADIDTDLRTTPEIVKRIAKEALDG